MEYDYIIIGGGSAGCVLASRLSADARHKVLLIEAGKSHHSPFIQIPFLTVFTLPLWIKNWHFITEPQAALNQRKCYQPRGKALGGSSSINAMIYTRGQHEDYDAWAQSCGAHWSFSSVLPIFRSFESNQQIHDQWHGQNGELSVTDLYSPNPASEQFVQAAMNCGHPLNRDFNGASQYGVGLYQVTQKNGRRHSAADAFLDPIAGRNNLTVMLNTYALKLIMDAKRCKGVYIRHRGRNTAVFARKKVILSAGAIKSPQLLLLSGIGSQEALSPFNIPLVHELPGVGLNFHDHPDYVLCYRSQHPDLLGFNPGGIWDMLKAYRNYRRQPDGMMTTNFAEAGGFLSTRSNDNRPDIQLHFVTGIVDNHARKIHFHRGMSCHVCVLRPKSRGSIRLRSSNPFHAPRIDPNFLSEESDGKILIEGYKLTRNIMEQHSLAPYRGKTLYPAASDEEILHRIQQRTDTVYHPVGSCRMGTDEMAVVDPYLRVHGIENLMVADASIMPQIISGNTNAPTMMIAEQAARFIREEADDV